jgi:hypothetical protein
MRSLMRSLMMMRALSFGLVLGTVVVLPRSSAAQQDPTPPASRLRVETISTRFVVAPDVRFTEVNDRSATLAGVYAGWLHDRTIFIGGGGYWLANRDDDFKVAYGGPIIGVMAHADRKLAFGARTLLGFGNATLSDTYGVLVGEQIRFGTGGRTTGNRRGFNQSTLVAFDDNFFVAEPQVNAVWKITNWLGVDAGVGYRLIAGSDLLDERLRGLSGSIALQFGR